MNKLAALFALAAITGWGASKEKDWQTAKLLDPDRTHYFAKEQLDSTPTRPGLNTDTNSGVSANQGPASPAVHDFYIVETQGMVYLAERIRLSSAPAAKLAVTRPIKFAVDKKNLYLMNENGEEYQTKILKQVERDQQK
jgi:hypothetical protein